MSVEISQHHTAIAQAKGFQVYDTYSEPEAAQILGVSLSTLSRLRHNGSIGFIQKSVRRVGYFGFHLIDYLLAQQSCPNTQPIKDSKLATTGSANVKMAQVLGSELGTIHNPHKLNAAASARRTLKSVRNA